MEEIKIRMLLQLMAEGGEGAPAGAEGATEPEGSQAGTESTTEPEDLEAEFDKLVKGDGKFRDVFAKRQQSAARNRNKGLQQIAERYNAMGPALDVLAARYGVAADDPALIEHISKDTGLLEERATKNGSTSETEMALARAAAAERRANGLMAQMLADMDYQKWSAQAEELKGTFPDFDLETELQNEQFRNMIQRFGLDVKSAYMALHHDDVVQAITRRATKQAADTVAANRRRPSENGTGNNPAAATGKSPMQMSRAEFAEYMKKVERGEKVDFTKR